MDTPAHEVQVESKHIHFSGLADKAFEDYMKKMKDFVWDTVGMMAFDKMIACTINEDTSTRFIVRKTPG